MKYAVGYYDIRRQWHEVATYSNAALKLPQAQYLMAVDALRRAVQEVTVIEVFAKRVA